MKIHRMADAAGAESIFDLHPGQVLWLDGAVHRWEVLAGRLEAVGVEIKAARPPAEAR